MPMIGMYTDISALLDDIAAGNEDHIIATARPLLQQGAPAAVIAGRVGMIAAHGDQDGHAILILDAAGCLSRWLDALPLTPEEEGRGRERELPLLVQALVATAPAVRAGQAAHDTYPEPLFPSGLPEGKTVDEMMHDAIYGNDAVLVERLLFGLYGTGADYRTMQVRIYDGISTTFQHAGHPLIFAVRGTQLLDAIEWGDRAPNILHWLVPHLPLHSEEPAWVDTVRSFFADPGHSLASLRTRLSTPKNENALPLCAWSSSKYKTRLPSLCCSLLQLLSMRCVKNWVSREAFPRLRRPVPLLLAAASFPRRYWIHCENNSRCKTWLEH